jgi:dipeptidase E
MRLYLSSYRLGASPSQLAALLGDNRNAAVITNALDFSSDVERRARSVQREIDALSALSIVAEELDLRDYFGDQPALSSRMATYGMVWVIGGNAFILRRAMRQCGFDAIIQAYRDGGDRRELVYAGYSAGAVVAARTLRGIHLMDEPEVVPEKYDPEVIWEGLGLVPYSIVPHYRSDHPEAGADEIAKRFFEDQGMPFRAIRDGEAIIEQLSRFPVSAAATEEPSRGSA